MLFLPSPTERTLNDYWLSINNRVESALLNSQLDQGCKEYLNDKIKDIIIGDPQNLIKYHEEFMPILIKGFTKDEFYKYLEIKSIKKKADTVENVETQINDEIIDRYKGIGVLSEIFNYDYFISKNKKTSYALAASLSRHTCTYCNRLYTTTIFANDSEERAEGSGITRPQFDHWFAKSKYPILALSFYNLIPSCNICNSSVKGSIDFTLQTHVHPYIKEADEKFSFSFNYKDIHTNNVVVKVKPESKMGKTLSAFEIQDIYNAHSALELKDLLELNYKYSDNYIEDLIKELLGKLGVSKHEAIRMIFGVELTEEDFYKRPFSKFKHDILKELKVIV